MERQTGGHAEERARHPRGRRPVRHRTGDNSRSGRCDTYKDEETFVYGTECRQPSSKSAVCPSPETLLAAIAAGADMAGFVFFEKSPRHIDLETARTLGLLAAGPHQQSRAHRRRRRCDARRHRRRHGARLCCNCMARETPGRVAAVMARFGLPVMKALGIATPADLAAGALCRRRRPCSRHRGGAGAVPGGNAAAFDWLCARLASARWLLAGGLTPANVAEALRRIRRAGGGCVLGRREARA